MKGSIGTARFRVVVAGIAGSGKTTVGSALARRLGGVYVDGDAVHSPENVAKMAAGTPLTDDDREPWLAKIRDLLNTEERIVVSCSALRRLYRNTLREAGGIRFVFLDVDRDVALQRAAQRTDHYMGPEMIDSQLATLEWPEPDEGDVAIVPCDDTVHVVVDRAIEALRGS